MRTSSATTSPERSSRTVVRAGSASLSFSIEKWRAASEAICGRCVMHRIWRPSASARSCEPTARGRVPADARVDLVEHERRLGAVVGDAHQGEHDARELAAGGDLAQRAGGDAGVRGDEELDGVGPARGRLALLQRDLEAGALHGQLGQTLADRTRQPSARPSPAPTAASRRPAPARRAPPRARPLPAPAPPRRPRARRAVRDSAPRGPGRRRSCRHACARGARARPGAPRWPPAPRARRRAPRRSAAAHRPGRRPRRPASASARPARRARGRRRRRPRAPRRRPPAAPSPPSPRRAPPPARR